MNRLKELREANLLTQDVCAKAAYISKKSYERYESGERVMPLDTAIFFAKFYKVSLDYLSGLTDDSGNPPNGRSPETISAAEIGIDPQLYFEIRRFSEKQQKSLASFLKTIK